MGRKGESIHQRIDIGLELWCGASQHFSGTQWLDLRHDHLVRASPDAQLLGLDAHQVILRLSRVNVGFGALGGDVFWRRERDG